MPSLATTPLPRLLLSLHREHFSGWLELRRGRVRRRLRWVDGNPLRVESSVAREGLCALLVERAQLEGAEAEKIRKTVETRGLPEIAALLASQAVAPKHLFVALRDQLQTALRDCLTWTAGEFSFEPARQEEAAPARLPLDLVSTVLDAVASQWRPDQVLASLGESATRFPRPGPGFDEARRRLPRDPSVGSLLDGLNGRLSLWEALCGAQSPRAHAFLFVLDGLGALEYLETRQGEGEGAQMPSGPELEIVIAAGAEASSSAGHPVAAQEEAGAISPEASSLREELLDLRGRLKEVTHYELLGVKKTAKGTQIKRAYLKLAKRLHPDALSRMGLEDMKECANEVFAQIGKAHATLSDVDQRRSYDAGLEGHQELDANLLAQAEALYRKGEIMMRAGNFLGALEHLEGAVRLWPEECDYQSALGWVLYKKNPPELARATEHLEKATSLDPRSAATLMRLSVVRKETGDAEASAQAQATAEHLDPNVQV